MLRTTTAVALFAASTIVAFADDPRAFIGEEFPMKGIACSNVLDTQKLGTLLIGSHIHLDEEILNTIGANKLSCKLIDQAAMYAGPAPKSEFKAIDRYFIIDRYKPVRGADDLYVWRGLHPVLSVRSGGGA